MDLYTGLVLDVANANFEPLAWNPRRGEVSNIIQHIWLSCVYKLAQSAKTVQKLWPLYFLSAPSPSAKSRDQAETGNTAYVHRRTIR